jgi:hypothetical protein
VNDVNSEETELLVYKMNSDGDAGKCCEELDCAARHKKEKKELQGILVISAGLTQKVTGESLGSLHYYCCLPVIAKLLRWSHEYEILV